MISYILALFLTLVLKGYLIWCNRQLDAMQDVSTTRRTGDNQDDQVELTQIRTQGHDGDLEKDLTDGKTIWFRYRT